MTDPLMLVALVMAVGSTALVVWGGRRSSVAPALTVAWVIHCILWCALPLVIQLFLAEPVADSLGPLSRSELAILHSASLLLLIVLHLAFKRPLLAPVTHFFDRLAPDLERLFWVTAAALALLVLVELRSSQVDGSNFSEVVAFAVTADAGQLAESGLLAVILGLLLGYAVALISMDGRTGVTRSSLCLAWCMLTAFCGFSMSRGSRTVVLLPAAAGLIAITTQHGKARQRAAAIVAVVGVITAFLGAPIASIMGIARGGTGSVSIELLTDAATVLLGSASFGQQLQVVAGEANRKFDAIGPGVELLAMEPPGSAGLAPLLSATVSPIPRLLYPTKPVPTSRDGTYLGTPYRIAAKAYGDPEVGMVVPVSASAIALWEFGLLGPLALLLANLMNLVLLNSLLLSRNVLVRAISIPMLALPNAEFLIGPPDVLLQNGLRLLLFLGVLVIGLLTWDSLTTSRRRAADGSNA